MAEFDVREPLGDDAQEGGVEADGGPDERDDDPALSSVVGLPETVPPAGGAVLAGAGRAALPGFAPRMFSSGVLDPICRLREMVSFCCWLRLARGREGMPSSVHQEEKGRRRTYRGEVLSLESAQLSLLSPSHRPMATRQSPRW